MAVSFDVILDAFMFVSMEQPYIHNAYLSKETGQTFFTSEIGDSDELPEDLETSDQYVAIPHKNELNLGKALVVEFTEEYLPEELDRVLSIFRKKGAYSRYKDLLERKGALQKWYQYEEDRQKAALREWCAENDIELSASDSIAGAAASMTQAEPPAIQGYDAVAYFKNGRALKGSPSFTFKWHDMVWHFSSRENRDLFAAAPQSNAPQYDGYCAWALTEGRKALTDPEVWKIIDGKLYLNCSPSAYEKWSRDIPGNIKKADEKWQELQRRLFPDDESAG